ncbi:hypothetical protein ACH4FX_40255, partial [Streptomyces sp. NPDC018019]
RPATVEHFSYSHLSNRHTPPEDTATSVALGALTEQPVVFLGSEGETGVVARNLGAFLWLLADGFGPMEATTSYKPDLVPQPDRDLEAIAEQFAPDHRASAAAVIEQATQEFPGFDDAIMALCR